MPLHGARSARPSRWGAPGSGGTAGQAGQWLQARRVPAAEGPWGGRLGEEGGAPVQAGETGQGVSWPPASPEG